MPSTLVILFEVYGAIYSDFFWLCCKYLEALRIGAGFDKNYFAFNAQKSQILKFVTSTVLRTYPVYKRRITSTKCKSQKFRKLQTFVKR